MHRVSLVIIACGVLMYLCGGPVFGFWVPEWEVVINDSIGLYSDTFNAGVGGNDGFVVGEDLLDAATPPFPGTALPDMPVKPYITDTTSVGGKVLCKDSRAGLVEGVAKEWQIDKYKYDPNNQVSGNETLVWDISGVPAGVQLSLIDYGNDSNRQTPVATVNMRSQAAYIISGVQGGTGTYRYLTLRMARQAAGGRIAGAVTLQGINAPNLSELITFEIRQPGTTTIVANGTNDENPGLAGTQITTGTDGSYAIEGVPAGAYDLTAKGRKWLRKKEPNITVTDGGTKQVNFALKGGDANNSNSVNVLDLNAVKGSYGKALGQPGYNEAADFNKSNSVNVLDLNILKGNYGQSGQ
jgi:hypothetical protein